MTTSAASEALSRARTKLIIRQPFFGVLALQLNLVEDPSVKTLAVNTKQVRYNPDYIMKLTDATRMSAMAHEVMHNVLAHSQRVGQRDRRKWNVAGDYVINLILQEAGFEIGEGWLLNPAFKGMTTDHVYSLLPDQGDGDDDNDEPQDDVEPDNDPIAEENWQIAANQAAKAAKASGKLPASLERFITEMQQGKVDWKAMLRRFMTEKNQADYSWSRPNRRFLAHGMYLPSLYSEGMGEVVAVIDTSGSIDNPTLTSFGSEIQAITDNASPSKTHVIYCDSRVNHVDQFEQREPLHFKMHGGGGTDFRPPFDHIESNDIKPRCLVYLTDGYGPFPATPPEYPVMWVMTTDVQPPWGEVVRLEL